MKEIEETEDFEKTAETERDELNFDIVIPIGVDKLANDCKTTCFD
jgi:hypothetical protein